MGSYSLFDGYSGDWGSGSSTSNASDGSGGGSWWSSIPWGQIFRGAAGAAAGYFGAQHEQDARAGAGEYGGTQTSSPWGPSIPYRQLGMDRALQLLGLGGSGAGQGGGGGGGGQGRQPLTAAPGWGGPEQGTRDLLEALGLRATSGSPYYGAAETFATGQLGGQDQNPYRADLYGRLGDLSDPDLARFKQMLFSGSMPGASDALGDIFRGAGGFSGLAGGGGGGGGGAPAELPVGAAEVIKEILGGKYLQGNPFLDDMVASATRGLKQDFYDRQLPGVLAGMGAEGRFGRGTSGQFLAQESGRLADAMGDINTQMRGADYEARMGDLMSALGLGTQMDMQASDLAQRAASSAASAGAARYGSQLGFLGQLEGLASQERLARMGALQGAIGQGIDLTQFGLAGQQGLAGLMSQDQNFALSMVPELSGLDIRDLTAALGGNMGLESLLFQGAEGAAGRQDAMTMFGAQQALQRQGMHQANSRYQQQRPWDEARMFLDLINSASAGGGSSSSSGQNNAWSPYFGDPWQQALAGGLGGYFGDWSSLFGGGGSQGAKTGVGGTQAY